MDLTKLDLKKLKVITKSIIKSKEVIAGERDKLREYWEELKDFDDDLEMALSELENAVDDLSRKI